MPALYPGITIPQQGGLQLVLLPYIRAPAMVALRPFIVFHQERNLYVVGIDFIRDIAYRQHIDDVHCYRNTLDDAEKAHTYFKKLVTRYLSDLEVSDLRMQMNATDSSGPYGVLQSPFTYDAEGLLLRVNRWLDNVGDLALEN